MHRDVIRSLDEPPLLVGHSLGGLIVQLLLEEGLGHAGVAIHSAPPKGVLVPTWSFWKSNLPALLQRGVVQMPPHRFHHAFTNHVDDPAEAQALYDAHAIPAASGVIHGPLTKSGSVDFDHPRPPLLMLAGGRDHIIPQSLNEKNARTFGSAAPTELRVYPDRTHWTLHQPRWEQVADDVLHWVHAQQP